MPRTSTKREKTPVVIHESESRTSRGAKYTVRVIRRRLNETFYTVEARYAGGGALVAERTTSSHGTAAMVAEAYEAGVFDLHTPLADLPAGLSRAMGRAWLAAEGGRCLPQAHVIGSKVCEHGSISPLEPAIGVGLRGLDSKNWAGEGDTTRGAAGGVLVSPGATAMDRASSEYGRQAREAAARQQS